MRYSKSRQNHLLGLALSLVLPLGVFAPKGLAPLFIITFFIIATYLPRFGVITDWVRLGGTSELFFAIATIFLIGVASSAWSVTPQQSFWAAITVGAMLFMGVAVSRIGSFISAEDRKIIEKYIFFGALCGFVLLGTEYLTNSFLTRHILLFSGKDVLPQTDLSHRLNAASSVGAILIWPWFLFLFRNFSFAPAVVIAGASVSIFAFSHASAPAVSVLIGCLVFLVSYLFYRQISVVFGLLAVTAIFFMPLGPKLIASPTELGSSAHFLPHSSVHRLFIWQTTIKHIEDRPILGHGFDTARSFYDKKNLEVIEFFPGQPRKSFKNFFEPIPLHPHNGVLQIWLEMGVLGALALVVILLAIIRVIYINCQNAAEVAMAYSTLSSALVLVSVSFGIWQNWWLAALMLIGLLSVFSNLTSRKNSLKR